jgi:hypothetical protein
MVIDIEIQRTAKADPNDPDRFITHVGGTKPDGTTWKLTEDDVIRCIESRRYAFYVRTRGGKEPVVIGHYKGRKYLKTGTERERPASLLRLPDCG